MYKRTIYLVFGKNYLAFGQREKIPSNEKGAKIPIKKNPHSSITNPFP